MTALLLVRAMECGCHVGTVVMMAATVVATAMMIVMSVVVGRAVIVMVGMMMMIVVGVLAAILICNLPVSRSSALRPTDRGCQHTSSCCHTRLKLQVKSSSQLLTSTRPTMVASIRVLAAVMVV